MGNTGKKKNTFWYFVFFAYVAVMLWLLFGRSNRYVEGVDYVQQLKGNLSLRPFYTIRNYFYVVTHHSQSSSLYRPCAFKGPVERVRTATQRIQCPYSV